MSPFDGLLSALLLHLLLILASCASDQRKAPFAIRISCGSNQDVKTPPSNAVWRKDFAYSGGRAGNASEASYIAPPLKTLRYFPSSDGPENCYTINDVPNGQYSVRIFFGIISDFGLEGEPLFDISIQGTLVSSLQPQWTINDDESFVEALVFVTDKTVLTCFHSTGHGDPSVLSIEILQVDDNEYNFGPQWGKGSVLKTTKRVSCGDDVSAFGADYGADPWGGDRFWHGVKAFDPDSDKMISTIESIENASVAPNFYPEKLYQSAIVATNVQPDIHYSMEVNPNKNYSIWLHFAEIDSSITAKGQRIFDVMINGDVVLKKVDIIGITGKPFAALVLNTTVLVDGKTLAITFHPTEGHLAIVSAIEVLEIIPAEFKTAAEEVEFLHTLETLLRLPLRLGWNGDPCVPQEHPWSGVACQFNKSTGSWIIDGLDLGHQGLQGSFPEDIARLSHLQQINASGNSIHGTIPTSIGAISGLETLDLSYNMLNGTIPDSLGELESLQILNLNSNQLSGKVPETLGAKLLHRASFNFTDNGSLCGMPGLRSCGPHLSSASKIGIVLGTLLGFLFITLFSVCWWKRRKNILRAKMLAARDAPYAKAKTHTHEVQLGRQRAHGHPHTGNDNGGSRLLK